MHLQFCSQDISLVVELALMIATQVALEGVETMEHLDLLWLPNKLTQVNLPNRLQNSANSVHRMVAPTPPGTPPHVCPQVHKERNARPWLKWNDQTCFPCIITSHHSSCTLPQSSLPLLPVLLRLVSTAVALVAATSTTLS